MDVLIDDETESLSSLCFGETVFLGSKFEMMHRRTEMTRITVPVCLASVIPSFAIRLFFAIESNYHRQFLHLVFPCSYFESHFWSV